MQQQQQTANEERSGRGWPTGPRRALQWHLQALTEQTSSPWRQLRGLHTGGTWDAWPEKGKGTPKDVSLAGHVDAPLKTRSTPELWSRWARHGDQKFPTGQQQTLSVEQSRWTLPDDVFSGLWTV